MLIKTIVTNTLILTELAKSVKIIYENKRIYAFTEISLNIDTLDVYEEFTYHLYGHVKQNDLHEVIKFHFEEKTKPNCHKYT